MKIVYEKPEKLVAMISCRQTLLDQETAKVLTSHTVLQALRRALEESLERVSKGLPVGITIDPVCKKCNDTHTMTLGEREVMCTFCPTPCEKCRGRLSAYCAGEPCPCVCHKKGT